MQQVELVSGMVMGFASAPGLPFFFVSGLEPDEPPMRYYLIVEGRPIERPKGFCWVSTSANAMKKQVGDALDLVGGTYRVVGIYETGVAWEDTGAVMALSEGPGLVQ